MELNNTLSQITLEDEVLRDGLQMESRIFSLEEKLLIFNLLKEAGLNRIQVGSFVHPKAVPQMADTDEFIKRIGKQEDITVTGLVLNDRGLDRALKSGLQHVSMSISVSNTHSLKNTRKSTQDALKSMLELIKNALDSGLQVRAGLQSAFGCAYEGNIREEYVLSVAESMAGIGIKEINLADTAGLASPISIKHLVTKVKESLPAINISLHLHDTRGLGLANMYAGYESGVRIFDVCTGGLGGCPFVKGAAGNIPTEDAVNMLEAVDVKTNININNLITVVKKLETLLNRSLSSRMATVIKFQNF
jgi:hydroxymethylglutaryl-CoA lyase